MRNFLKRTALAASVANLVAENLDVELELVPVTSNSQAELWKIWSSQKAHLTGLRSSDLAIMRRL